MLQYVLAGLALGSIYAIAAAGLVATFVSAGILNLAFGSMAYLVARIFFWLNSQHHWSSAAAGAFCLLVVGPLVGIILYALLFRLLRTQTTLVKLVATIGLSVALPPAADLVFGTQTITTAPGLASSVDKPFHFLGAPVQVNTVITYGFVLFVLIAGTAVLRFTDVGLRVRAMVDSEAMTSLSGTNPELVAAGVWAVSATLAGLAGILVAPTNGLTSGGMTSLMAAAFAAVVAARLRSLPIAVLVSFAMGIVTDVIQKYLPPNSSFTVAIIPSIPFAFILVFLLIYIARSGTIAEASESGGPLDRAIRTVIPDRADATLLVEGRSKVMQGLPLIPLIVVGILPVIFHSSTFWLSQTAEGACWCAVFLSFTIVTGEGGMLWLSQVIFAGAGAIATGQFATVYHLPVLLAMLIGGLLMAIVGAIIGLLTIRLGDLYVGLVTLTFGLLIETLVFSRNRFAKGGLGVLVNRPDFAKSDFKFAYLALIVFAIFAILTLNLRRSTSGLALRAVRDSEQASRMMGISVIQVKVVVGAVAAFVAAIGGGLVAMDTGSAQPQSFDVFGGLVWLAVVVTMGIRSITAAALAGMSFQLFPAVFQTWIPSRWGQVPSIMFGLGAISVARDPDGVLAAQVRQFKGAVAFFRRSGSGASAAAEPGADTGAAVSPAPAVTVPAPSPDQSAAMETRR